MILRTPTNCGDETCPSCVVAGDHIFLAHHCGGHDSEDVAHQMRITFARVDGTLRSVGASLDDLVQINLYLKTMADFPAAQAVFPEFFKQGYPARMTSTTEFFEPACRVMVDGIAFRKRLEGA